MGTKDMGTAKKIAVIAPTTGGLVHINGLKPRPRLQHSYVTITGDFRPLAISPDYHRLVSGPMAAAGVLAPVSGGERSVYELSLSGDIDSGRSWELPTLVAHLALSDERLVAAAGNERATTPAPASQSGSGDVTLIWATGMVDPDLAAPTGDYAVRTKTALSNDTLCAHRDAGGDVRVIVSAALPEDDLAHLREWSADHGFQFAPVASLESLRAALGIAAVSDDAGVSEVANAELREPVPCAGADTQSNSGDGNRQAPGPVSVAAPVLATAAARATATEAGAGAEAVERGSGWPAQRVAIAGGLILATAVALWMSLQTGLLDGSSPPSDPNPARTTELSLTALRASNREDCIERIMAVQSLSEVTVPWDDAVGQNALRERRGALSATNELCGFALANRSAGARDILLDPALQAHLIAGPNARMRSVTLAPGAALRFVLRSVPAGKQFAISTRADGKPSDRYTLRFE